MSFLDLIPTPYNLVAKVALPILIVGGAMLYVGKLRNDNAAKANEIVRLSMELDKFKAQADEYAREKKALQDDIDQREAKRQHANALIHDAPKDPAKLRQWILDILEATK